MDFVTHTCKKCGCAFVAEDYTNCQDIPPHWRYCPNCSESLGIDYDKQKPWTNRTKEQNERYKKFAEIGKQNIQKYKALNRPH